ncbi:GGDEF domain-containing protein [Kutzneria viridogrisea]|uniref:Diguanylate cyclase (GGDEF)-like protein n=1 Tax=Kutzneria viridogrisea TaxID=47990 RepID=A0ABR6BKD1_9PSEU|nr:diguanylate cyclase (GGDEF)-like protein [Kutzneria viridogrisea]
MRAWALWKLPRTAVAYVLLIELIALALITVTAGQPVREEQWISAGAVLAAAVAHLHLSHSTERIRRDHSHLPHVDLCSIWTLAGALLLPALPEVLLVLAIYAHRWWLVGRWDASRPPHRTLFTAAMMIVTALAVVAVSSATGLSAHLAAGRLAGWGPMAALLAAMAVQWLVNTALVAGIILITAKLRRRRDAVGSGPDNLLELAQLVLGGFTALATAWWPGFALLMAVPMVALHRTVLLHQLQLAARTDDKTGLLNATTWHQQAQVELVRARQENRPLGLLMIDLDHFSQVNNVHGHLAGDAVLRAVARLLGGAVRRGDSVGRFGGEEFAVLLPGIDQAGALAVAERIRAQVRALVVDSISGFTVSVGVAVHPAVDEDSVDGLIAAADTALYAAKDAGRDLVRLAGGHRGLRWLPTNRN